MIDLIVEDHTFHPVNMIDLAQQTKTIPLKAYKNFCSVRSLESIIQMKFQKT